MTLRTFTTRLAARALLLVLFGASSSGVVARQDGLSVLNIKAVLVGADGRATPVPRHVLLVSDNPPTSAPRQIRTGPDGTVSMRLPPGNYTVESDQPVSFQGKAYHWTQTLDIAPGREAVLELTTVNAELSDTIPTTARALRAPEASPSSLLTRWQSSVVTVWSPTASASGFVIDTRGLIVTNHRVIGSAASVEVQLTPVIKVAARVLAGDPVRDVALLLIDPRVIGSIPPIPLGCTRSGASALKDWQELVAVEAPFRRPKGTTDGMVYGIEGRFIMTDLDLEAAGGPVFAGDGSLVGISSLLNDDDDHGGADSRVVRVEEVCALVASAEAKMKDAAAPEPTPLPVEPEHPFPIEALKAAAQGTSLRVDPYRLSSSSFDVTFITPVLIYAAQNQSPQTRGRVRSGGEGRQDSRTINPLDDFSNWSEYVRDAPPVLMIRVTPKLVEGFWTKVARGAAQTQGVSLPPIKRFKPGFARLQAFCGDVEVTPIHPFKLEQRVSESDAIYEGLYVFDPGALSPSCGTVKLVLYSEKDAKGDTRVVDAKVLQRIRDDFVAYRSAM